MSNLYWTVTLFKQLQSQHFQTGRLLPPTISCSWGNCSAVFFFNKLPNVYCSRTPELGLAIAYVNVKRPMHCIFPLWDK